MKKSADSSIPTARVLVVDDNKRGLATRKSILQDLKLDVVATDSAVSALALLTEGHFDLLVTDYKMPEMDGIELIQRIKALKPRLRVILVSGFVDTLGLTEESTGADAVVAKTNSEVAALTRAVLRLTQAAAARKSVSRVALRAKASNL
jgi:CheY-like chemotaxis protein